MNVRPIILSIALTLALACTTVGEDQDPVNTGPPTGYVSPTPQPEGAPPAALELIRGPVSEDGLQAIFATPDIGVGTHRVAFALTSRTSLVDAPSATVQSFFEPDGETLGEPVQTSLAIFRPFPLVQRGLYTTKMSFDRPGRWGIQATVLGEDGSPARARLYFDVPNATQALTVGAKAFASVNRTAHDVERLSQLTTGSMYDVDLYQMTIADAIQSGLPTVIVMASPAFCTNAVCGPQVDVLRELKNEFEGQANFIHIDFFDNPEEIQGDLSRAVVSSVAEEWLLPSSEWSFVVDRLGIISDRFEGFATLEELRIALTDVL